MTTGKKKLVVPLSLGALLLGMGFLTACGPTRATGQGVIPPRVPLEEITFVPATDRGYLLEGKRVYQVACSLCHSLDAAARAKLYPTDAVAVKMAVGMTQRANLDADDAAGVIHYLLALRHNLAP